jgi:hypothetical protein
VIDKAGSRRNIEPERSDEGADKSIPPPLVREAPCKGGTKLLDMLAQ